MKEKERGKNETEKLKKVPMRESNPRPLNLQPPHIPPQGLIARTIPTYTANLNGHELRVASLAALAPPIKNSGHHLGNKILSFIEGWPYLRG